MNQDIKYNFSADIIRAVSILGVVTIHVFADYIAQATDFQSSNWWLSNTVYSMSKVAVPLFIMLSGFLLLDSKKPFEITSFYKKRFYKLGFPLLFWPLFYYFSYSFLTSKALNIMTFTSDYIFLNMFFHLYFLFIIAGLYIITPILKLYIENISPSQKKMTVIIAMAFSICITLLHYIYPSKFNYWTIFTVSFPFIAYYLAGDYLRKYSLSSQKIKSFVVLYIVSLAITLISKYFIWTTFTNTSVRNYFSDAVSIHVILLSLLSFALLLNLSKRLLIVENGTFKKLVSYISATAFGIYIVHPLFLFAVNKFPIQFPLSWIFLIIKTFIVLILSFIMVSLLRKVRYLRLLFP